VRALKALGGRLGMRLNGYRAVKACLGNGQWVEVVAAYFVKAAPKGRRRARQQGAYLGLEVLGFLRRWSSRLVSEVAQAAFLCPSLAVAHTVLGRWGLALDVKTLRGVCRALADRARSFRGEISLTGVWNAYGSCCPIVDELDTRLVAPMEMLPKLGQAFALVNRT
jgi:hypothetical protein